ncbi:MAG TPA: S-adenosylmethionine decarboxylase [Verrucomicrobiae bacterium]|jgi:S-adenosylmethionine decarboxylase|nr:S-adenosylmethionine decarboxylase [Verrucomicrobiae bacterium]
MKTNKHQKLKVRLSRHCLGTIITSNQQKLFDAAGFMAKVQEILEAHSTQCLGELTHEFQNKSFTCLIGLAESHISVHTWPERYAVQLDVFLCNYMRDNSEKCRSIFDDIVEYFEPVETNETIIDRI